jgi:formylglycine-generating enzyme required for sulfatase activity
MPKFREMGPALGIAMAAASCAPSSGEETVHVHDAAGADETRGAAGGGETQQMDASGRLESGAGPDGEVVQDGALADAGALEADRGEPERDAFGDDSAAPGDVWENGLGMRFVSVPGTSVMFSIWETRAQDYEAFARATGAAIPKPDFAEAALQPKASVSRAQAEAFATWLTDQERKDGKLGPIHKYRLPTDHEWDVAMEVGATGGPYPWGAGFPPPDKFANYGITNDGFTYTSPVGTFAPNGLGLYDMAGNLWEWIGEGCASGGAYLVRGCGWNAAHEPYFVLTFHYCFPDDLVGHHNVGFRIVLEGGRP